LKHLMHGLLDDLLQMSQSLRGEQFKAIHEQYFALLTYVFNEVEDRCLRGRLLSSMLLYAERVDEYSAFGFCSVLIKTNPDLLQGMSLSESLRDAFVSLYVYLEANKQQATEPANTQDMQGMQEKLLETLIARLTSTRKTEHLRVAEILHALNAQEMVHDKSLIESGLAKIDEAISTAAKANVVSRCVSVRPPKLLDVAWCLLNSETQEKFVGVSARAIDNKSQPSQQALTVFGHIGEAFIGVIRKGGFIVGAKTTEEAQAVNILLENPFLQKMAECAEERGADAKAEKEDAGIAGIAATCDVAFVGAYLDGGVTLIRDETAQTAIAQAAQLARERLQQRGINLNDFVVAEEIEVKSSEANLMAGRTDSPIRALAVDNLPASCSEEERLSILKKS